MEILENQFLRVAISEHGAELSSIYDKEKDHEAVWTADPAYWNRHAPVLFPFVGKVNGGHYRYQGKEYSMGQHGFARDMDFELAAKTEDSVTFVLDSNAETLVKYPFAFRFSVTHRLEGRTLSVIWKVENPSEDEPMYFSVGGHPAFNVPADKGQEKTDYYVKLETADKENFVPAEELTYILIDPEAEAADSRHPETMKLEKGVLPITETLFDRDAFIFDQEQIGRASLLYPDGSTYVRLTCQGFPSFGLWSKPHSDAPYVCLEPWIGRVDNKGFAGELPEKFGEQVLDAEGTFEASYTIEVF